MPSKFLYTRYRDDEDASRAGWQIVYTSFILILLSFFIMLSSFATMDSVKVMRFARSFADAVNIFTGGLSFEHGQTILGPSTPLVDKESELAEIFHAVGAYTEALELEKEVELTSSAKGIVMTLSDKALFQLGDAKIAEAALPLLNKVGAIISQTGYFIRIEGHTDNLPILTDQYPSNWELSTARAVNVLRYFVENLQIPARRLYAVGFGEFQPKYPNDSAVNQAQNRRVEIIFMGTDEDNISEELGK